VGFWSRSVTICRPVRWSSACSDSFCWRRMGSNGLPARALRSRRRRVI